MMKQIKILMTLVMVIVFTIGVWYFLFYRPQLVRDQQFSKVTIELKERRIHNDVRQFKIDTINDRYHEMIDMIIDNPRYLSEEKKHKIKSVMMLYAIEMEQVNRY